jgi:thiol-disulfide isomerase/thioredoxin
MKRLILIATAAIFLLSCSTDKFKITGNIEGIADQMVLLKTMIDNELVTTDSTLMKGGKFSFTGSVSVPDIYAIDFENDNERIILFLENSNVTIAGSADNIMGSTITGSATHDLLLEFNKLQEELSEPLMEVYYRYQTAAMEGTLTPEMEAQIQKEYMDENKKMVVVLKDFAIKNGHSVVSAYITVSNLINFLSIEELEEVVNSFSKDIQTSPFVKTLNDKLNTEKVTAIGQSFIDFTHPDKDGNMISFASVIGEKYVLLDFWAGWCAPCRRENPHLVSVYKKYNEKGFDIFGVSLDRSREEWLDAIATDGLLWQQVSDISGWENNVAKLYGVQSIPANLLIDPNGKIIAKNLRGADLDAKLAELFD